MNKVYESGLRPPTEGVALVHQQLRLAHEYRVALTQLARARRAVERELELAEGLHVERDALLEAVRLLGEALTEAKTAKMVDRSRTVPEAERIAVESARKNAREASSRFRARRKELSPLLKAERDKISLRWKSMRRSLRRHFSRVLGLRHGTYTAVEQQVYQACSDMPPWEHGQANDPRWPDWTGEGRIGVQIQNGLTVAEVFGGESQDTRFRIGLEPDRLAARRPQTNGRGRPVYATVRLRVGTAEFRSPVWAGWPCKLHRLPPAQGMVKHAMVQMWRAGPRTRWTLQLTVAEPSGYVVEPCGHGVVAVDIGWRRIGDELRVCAWRDEFGDSGYLRLDENTIEALRRPEKLRKTRDDNLNTMKAELCSWLRSQPLLPDWLLSSTVKRRETMPTSEQAIATLSQWRSPARWTSLATRWKGQRWPTDQGGYELLEAWRYRDHHLWEYESGQRAGALGLRRDQYRVFAAWLSRTYATIVLERFDKRRVARKPEVEEVETEQQERAQSWRQLAATSTLCNAIVSAAGARGARIVYERCDWSTQDCPKCGHQQNWDAAATVRRRPPCPKCGCGWDQDYGSCVVLLQRYRERPGGDPNAGGARKRRKVSDPDHEGETRWQRAARLGREKEDRMETARKTEPMCG